MRKVLMAVAGAAAVAVLAGGGLASASPRATAAATWHAPLPGATVINLHRAYEKALPHVKKHRLLGVIYARGRRPQAPAGGLRGTSTCGSGTLCPLVYGGGPVQYNPHVYLLLWGPAWSTPAEAATAQKMEGLLNGLGEQPSDSWSRVMSEYSNGGQFPSFLNGVYMGVWNDTSTPPYQATPAQFAAEADAFASSHGIADRQDAQVVVAAQSGTCPQSFSPSGCDNSCGWHDVSTVPYIGFPYVLDQSYGCGEDLVNGSNGTYDGLTSNLASLYADTVTDPYGTGWQFPGSGDGDTYIPPREIDCYEYGPMANVQLWNGSYVLAGLWSNAADSCVMSPQFPDTVTISNPGNQKTIYPAGASLTISGKSSGGNELIWHAVGLPPGMQYVSNPATGQITISGTPTTVGTFAVTVDASDRVGAVATSFFDWTVSAKICPPRICG